MKTKLFLIVLVAMFALNVNAQTDPSSYLNKALEKLETGDCETAQKYYNVYKDLSGKAKSSVEVLIDDCKKNNDFQIGNFIEHNGAQYVIAYLTENKKHGYAIKDAGIGSITRNHIEQQLIPSYEELVNIYNNRDELGLSQEYWCSKYTTASLFNGSYFETMIIATTINFANGVVREVNITHKRNILLVYRF